MNRFLCVFLSLCVFFSLCTSPALAAGSTTNSPKILYKDLLDQYYAALSERWDRDSLESKDFSYLYAYSNNPAEIGYTFIDIDSNGVQELLIGEVNAEGNYRGMIYDLYTVSDGGTTHILSSGERDRYYLCNNGVIANEGSSGAAYSTQSFYILKQGTTLSLLECVIADGTETPSSPWYYSTTVGADGYTYLNKVSISEARAKEIIDTYLYQEISYTPFDQWPTEKAELEAISLQPTTPADLAEALVTVHWGGLVTEDASTTFHPGGAMTQAISVTALGLLSGLTASEPEEEAPVQSPSHPRPSYLVDYLGMTVDQVAAIWGRDYIYIGGWYAGSALGFYYEDWRVPCTFYVNDLSYRGFADGNDLIFLLSCPADSEIPLAEGIPSNSTYPQLQAAGITGEFYTGEDANSGYGESASLYYQYNSAIMIEFCWYEESDPYTMPPEEIFIISLSVDT